jgi:hypothetical protein
MEVDSRSLVPMVTAGNTKAAPLVGAGRWGPDPIRFVWLAAVVGMAVADARAWLIAITQGFDLPTHPGVDFDTYRGAAERFLAGQGFYYPWQLTGPYEVWNHVTDPILYPPTTIPLFAAFTFLPSFLYWAIPLAIIGGVVVYHRPRPLALVLAVLLIAWPNGLGYQTWFGNPTMWIVAVMSLATIRPGFAPFVLLKPSLFPFALWGIRHRDWWIGLALFALVSLPFAPLWLDYLRVLANNRGTSGLLYSVWNATAMLVPVVARIGAAPRSQSAGPPPHPSDRGAT